MAPAASAEIGGADQCSRHWWQNNIACFLKSALQISIKILSRLFTFCLFIYGTRPFCKFCILWGGGEESWVLGADPCIGCCRHWWQNNTASFAQSVASSFIRLETSASKKSTWSQTQNTQTKYVTVKWFGLVWLRLRAMIRRLYTNIARIANAFKTSETFQKSEHFKNLKTFKKSGNFWKSKKITQIWKLFKVVQNIKLCKMY